MYTASGSKAYAQIGVEKRRNERQPAAAGHHAIWMEC
ncbi:Uncharacterised protein [Escherichia coli]|uniref:Uncharacterized protein n=1 Tax=Escherichia coli TaxID=562 RepID=A0A2X3K907_ECOLX|nr:Uncharacterised protein [Escherichia coli]